MAQQAMAQQMMQQALEGHLLNAAKAMEDSIDDELHRLDNMDEDDMDRLREKRLAALKKQQAKKKVGSFRSPTRALASASLLASPLACLYTTSNFFFTTCSSNAVTPRRRGSRPNPSPDIPRPP